MPKNKSRAFSGTELEKENEIRSASNYTKLNFESFCEPPSHKSIKFIEDPFQFVFGSCNECLGKIFLTQKVNY